MDKDGLNRRLNKPIGVFDSGLGGLTVVRQINRYLPEEDIVYFGDLANLPYGTKSREQIARLSVRAAEFLNSFKIKLLVSACNSSSATSLAVLKRRFRLPIVGVIEPVAREAVKITQNKRIGIIGTNATIESRAYQKKIKRLDPAVKILAKSCPLLVPLVEEGWLNGKIVQAVIEEYLEDFKDKNIDTLILGCTHYPLLKNTISRVMGKKTTLLDSAYLTACKVKEILAKKEMLVQSNHSKIKFYVSDLPDRFKVIGRKFLGRKIRQVSRVRLDV